MNSMRRSAVSLIAGFGLLISIHLAGAATARVTPTVAEFRIPLMQGKLPALLKAGQVSVFREDAAGAR